MLRVSPICVVILVGFPLAGCSASSTPISMGADAPSPSSTTWLRFESEPSGADVSTLGGQTCQTPCALPVPLASQSVTFAKNGYVPQTLPVDVRQLTGRSADGSLLGPQLSPNPVEVELQVAPPIKPVTKAKFPKTAATSATIKSSSSKQASDSFPAPPLQSGGPFFPPPPR